MHDLGGLIWVILVLIGVISSLVKNARRAAAARRAAMPTQPQRPPTAPPPPAPRPRPQFVQSATFEMPPVIAPVPVPVPVPAAIPVPAPVAASVPAAAPPPTHVVRPNPIRGMFEGPATLVRAIVAAEVLGPPKSMQEQTIWSPRHSEPSI